jgi:aliphatic nitrilase
VLKEYPKFRAAAVQIAPVYHDKPVYFDMPATLDNAVKAIKEAASNGAELVAFPELHIPGYCHFALELTLGPEYTGIWAEYLRHGIEVPSEETDILCRAARENKVNVVMGINERVAKYGGRQHNSSVFINKQGEIVHVHRKINITVQELLIHTRGNGGKNLWIPEFDFGKTSSLICGEHNQPMLWNNYIIQGAKVNCSMWPGYLGGAEELPWVTPAMTTAIASTGAMWCVLAAEYIPPEKRPKDFYPNTSFYQSFGGSGIISPFGEIVSGPLRDQEGIVYGDIDLKVNEMARGIINITGIYSRWDILSLRVRQNDYEPIVPMEAMELGAPAGPMDTWQGTSAGAAAAPTVPMASLPPTAAQRAAEASPEDVKELKAKVAELERRLAEAEGRKD